MLQYQTIEPATLELLRDLLDIPEFKNLRLAGGTSLALQIGHRKSIDLDLFGAIEIEPNAGSVHCQICRWLRIYDPEKSDLF